MAYVYRHIRVDKNVPFYIGIGLREDGFKRAFTKLGRNKYWNNIVSKTDYEVEILLDEISNELAYKKEQEFISLYKRHKEGGTLSNLTLGGEGQVGMIPWNFGKETPEETKKKQSLKKIGKPSCRKGVKITQDIIDAMAKGREGIDVWNKGKKMNEKYIQMLKDRMKGKPGPMVGKKHSEETKAKFSESRKGQKPWNKGMTGQYKMPNQIKRRKKVLQFSMEGVFIAEYESATFAAKKMGSRKSDISGAATGRRNFHKGFVWKYK